MDDPFALLGLPRRPLLDEVVLKSSFLSRAADCHPDKPGGDADRFAALNAARSTLADPAARLRLLAGGVEASSTPPDPDMGFRVGALLREVDAILARSVATRNPLERALVAGEVQPARGRVEALLAEIDGAWERALGRLRDIDAVWPEGEPVVLAALGAEFRFLARWRAQLRERALALSL